MKGKFDAYAPLTFHQNSSKLNSRLVYCWRLYGTRYYYGAKAGVWNSSLASVHFICYDFHGNFNCLPYLPIAIIKTCVMLTKKEGLQRTVSCSNVLGEDIKSERTMCIMCSKKVTSKSLLSSLYTPVDIFGCMYIKNFYTLVYGYNVLHFFITLQYRCESLKY